MAGWRMVGMTVVPYRARRLEGSADYSRCNICSCAGDFRDLLVVLHAAFHHTVAGADALLMFFFNSSMLVWPLRDGQVLAL